VASASAPRIGERDGSLDVSIAASMLAKFSARLQNIGNWAMEMTGCAEFIGCDDAWALPNRRSSITDFGKPARSARSRRASRDARRIGGKSIPPIRGTLIAS